MGSPAKPTHKAYKCNDNTIENQVACLRIHKVITIEINKFVFTLG